MKAKEKFNAFLEKHPVANAIFTDKSNKAVFLTALKIALDLGRLVIQIVALILSPSYWYTTLAVLYLVYLLTKLYIVVCRVRKGTSEESQRNMFRRTGILLLVTILPFSSCIVLIYTMDMSFAYSGLLLYANATWTFFRIILSTVNVVKDRKQDLYLKAVRNINVASALVSIATLQVAMLHAYWQAGNHTPFTAITGGVISAVIITMAIYMIVFASINHHKNN